MVGRCSLVLTGICAFSCVFSCQIKYCRFPSRVGPRHRGLNVARLFKHSRRDDVIEAELSTREGLELFNFCLQTPIHILVNINNRGLVCLLNKASNYL